uniref:Uncharacterized protein n=1 Tax=Knipowitschia caucasica TaxID=637954 RepID=A0AAV2ME78_KNICA
MNTDTGVGPPAGREGLSGQGCSMVRAHWGATRCEVRGRGLLLVSSWSPPGLTHIYSVVLKEQEVDSQDEIEGRRNPVCETDNSSSARGEGQSEG